uniref:DNA translocase FtsK 4TM domain-containing protein n=1 Tax=Siccirubricoccus phaeus TaxID=2595053 RepID=UPI00165A1E8A
MPRAAPATADRATAGVRRFASPAVRAAIRRRLYELLGLVAALAGLALLVALASYNPADPSLSTATTARPSNLAGPAGAMLADLLLQGFGWAAALPGLALLAWAWRLATQRGLSLFPARLAALLAGMPCLAAALTLTPMPGPGGAAAGGVAGALLGGTVLQVAEAVLGPLGRLIGDTVIIALTLLLAVIAFGLSPGEWLGLGRAARRGALGAARAGGAGARGAAGLFGRLFGRLRAARPRRAMP